MPGNIIIKIIAVVLILHAVSPVCRAFGNGAPAVAGALSAIINPSLSPAANGSTASDPLPVIHAARAHESCWFTGAHLFESPVIKPIMPSVFALVAMAFLALISLFHQPATVALHWSLPYRSPPSQSLLQVFRI